MFVSYEYIQPKNNIPYNVGFKVKQQLNQAAIMRLLLDLYFPSAVLLGEILLILLHFRLLDLDRLNL